MVYLHAMGFFIQWLLAVFQDFFLLPDIVVYLQAMGFFIQWLLAIFFPPKTVFWEGS